METYSFNFCNLSLYQAVEQIVAQENLNFGSVYNNFKVCCKEGFYNLSVTVDKDGVWAYSANEIDEDSVLAGITTTYEDGKIDYRTEILTREQFNIFKSAADTNPHCKIEYEDLLANW